MLVTRPRTSAAAAAAVAVGTFATGCANSGAAVQNEQPTIVTSSYPLTFVAERIGGPNVEVVDLSAASADAHDLELTPRQAGEIAHADVMLYHSGYQPAVADAVEQNAEGTRVDVAARLDIAEPHFWLDPTLLSPVAEAVASALSDVVPDQAAELDRRADALVGELTALDSEFRIGLAVCTRRTVVASHDAFGQLADRYGLEIVGIAGTEPDAEPSPARVREVEELIRREQLTIVFYEPLLGPAVAETIAADLGISTAVLDPIEGLTEQTRDQDYFSLMRANLAALAEANGCA